MRLFSEIPVFVGQLVLSAAAMKFAKYSDTAKLLKHPPGTDVSIGPVGAGDTQRRRCISAAKIKAWASTFRLQLLAQCDEQSHLGDIESG